MNMKNLFYMVVTCLVLFSGCHTKQPATEKKQPRANVANQVNAKWMLIELNGYALEKDSFDREKPGIEIQSQNKMYFGYSGCNRMNGQLNITQSTIEFKPGPMTRMACIDGGNIETDFLQALAGSKYYVVTGDQLTLKNAGGSVTCKFTKQR